ncbi:MAG TPA: ribosomal subunit interface protein [Gemmata sp.]
MHIEVSTDTRTTVDVGSVTAEVETGLSRHRERLTRVAVYLSDVNGPKGGTDCRCALEARPAGRQPVAVTSEAASPDEAVSESVEKMDRLLASTFERLDDRKGGTSASGQPS